MNTPCIVTNFKNYPSALGMQSDHLVKAHIAAAKKTGHCFAVAVGALDIWYITDQYGSDIPVFAQHADNAEYGSSTGKIIPEELKKRGVAGVVLHHSENRCSDKNELYAVIEKSKIAGLTVIVCAENADEGEEIMNHTAPDFIAVEPPELIGGDISVSTARPELIDESILKIGTGKVLVGAGVKNGDDVRIAVEKGSSGVLLASGVTKANDPEKVLIDLVSQL